MDTEALFERGQALAGEHWEVLTLLLGAVLVLGTVRNWSWLCDPAGTRQAYSAMGRGGRRVVLGALGALLVGVSLWQMAC